MTKFEPIGDQARWKYCYDLMQEKEVNDVITYDEFADKLDGRVSRPVIQQSVRVAAMHLLEKNNTAVEVVRNVGYRIVEAHEHLDLSRRDQIKSTKALKRGHKLVTHVDMNDITDPQIKRAFGVVAEAFMMQLNFNRHMDVRQRNLEESMARVKEELEAKDTKTREEVDELRDRLARLESKM